MTLRKLFVVTAAIAALGVAAGAAFAQTAQQKSLVDAAKARGEVGELSTGYLAFRTGSSDAALTAAVAAVNDGRRQAYAQAAPGTGVSVGGPGAPASGTIVLPRISSGQWYRNAQGQWVQR